MSEFTSDDEYLLCGQESFRRNRVAFIVTKQYEMQYLGAISKTIELSWFVSKADHSTSQ